MTRKTSPQGRAAAGTGEEQSTEDCTQRPGGSQGRNGTDAAEQLRIFAACVFDPTDLVEIRRLPSTRSTYPVASELPKEAATLEAENATDNIHVGANPRTRRDGRSRDDVALARCLFADFDATTVDDALAKCTAVGLPTPTLTVSSGHGAHVYWRLTEPLIDLGAWTVFQKGLIDVLCSDGAIHDPARCMRLPGFLNHKKPTAACCVVDADPDRVYGLAELAKTIPPRQEPRTLPATHVTLGAHAFSPLEKLVRASADAAKWEPVEKGGRSNAAVRRAARLCLDFELSDAEAFPILQAWNASNIPPMDERELRQCFSNGRKYGKSSPGCALDRQRATPMKRGTDTLPQGDGPPWQTLAEIAARPTFRCGLQTVSTGFSAIDACLGGGLRPESMYILAGQTGSAKSTVALNIARMAAMNKSNVLVFKLEESYTESVWRILSATTQVNLSAFMDGGQALEAHRKQIDDGLELLDDPQIRISDHRSLNGIVRIAHEHVEAGGQLIIVDQLSMIMVPEAALGYERTTIASNTLRLLARELRIPILAVAQVNRNAAQKGRGKLESSDLRDSGHLENDAAAVMMLDCPPVRKRRLAGSPYGLDLHVRKNRYGPLTEKDAPITLHWWPWFCRIQGADTMGAGR